MYVSTQTTAPSLPTLLSTPTTTPNSPLSSPSSPTFGPDTIMNLIFGLSAFAMASVTIWQNRHYLQSTKMPWGKEPRRVRRSSGGFPARAAQILDKTQAYYEQRFKSCPLQSVDPKVTTSVYEHAIKSSPLDTPSGCGAPGCGAPGRVAPGLGLSIDGLSLSIDPQIIASQTETIDTQTKTRCNTTRCTTTRCTTTRRGAKSNGFVQFDEFFHLSDSASFIQQCESVPSSSRPTFSEPSGSSSDYSRSWNLQFPIPASQTPMHYSTPQNDYFSSNVQMDPFSSRSYKSSEICAAQAFSPTQNDHMDGRNQALSSIYSFERPPTTYWSEPPPFAPIQPPATIPISPYNNVEHAASSSTPASLEFSCHECPRSFESDRKLQRHLGSRDHRHRCTIHGCRWSFSKRVDRDRHSGLTEVFFCGAIGCKYHRDDPSGKSFPRKDTRDKHFNTFHNRRSR
ncbi:hypothetical protein N431DRAFT_521733 [Stipitochalara longipes BDJ]|nr:hypothetical protein N431DRAFT_521733 [Stipitochalara longipes BDJ]